MSAARRWLVVAVVAVLVVALPIAVRAVPVRDGDVGADELLDRVRAAEDHAYSGLVQTRGTLALPEADRFSGVAALLSETTRMRVWWNSPTRWRVAEQLLTGEEVLVKDPDGLTTWDFERQRVDRSADPAIRLPRTSDLLPPALAGIALEDAADESVSRVPTRRVAGRQTDGLRIVPRREESSIAHVDLWSDRETGVVLALDVYGEGSPAPAFSTAFTSFDPRTPALSDASFTEVPPGAELSFDDVIDIADAVNQFADLVPPDRVLGMEPTESSTGAVRIYGSGLTRLLVMPMRSREADPLREQLRRSPGAATVQPGVLLRVGPLGVLLTDEDVVAPGSWLVAGTLEDEALVAASADLRGWGVADDAWFRRGR